ncbi:hypothetical protein DFJ58DRAFT_843523 [Suillus subalutaceus]|uniref:uncharacterized protein n=1 Tax=Suillus subalutaceus TaxID=48586 RepID=UPI001B861DC3|nr:uncharacterized protein DFJ58DRAFT_843523 [Suillus subalutaceus]KAG1846198.1 hypothetical protein DFJ58DRAFT_843523 [Suillus subalutaceus]
MTWFYELFTFIIVCFLRSCRPDDSNTIGKRQTLGTSSFEDRFSVATTCRGWGWSSVVLATVTQKEVARMESVTATSQAFFSSKSYVQHDMESRNLEDECV